MRKRIASSILCGVLFFLSVAAASAFVKIGEGGFGDSANSYSWSVQPFKGDLYVGTNRHHLHRVMEALTLMPGSPISPEMLPAELLPDPPAPPPANVWFTPAWANAFQGEIWRYTKANQWERVHTVEGPPAARRKICAGGLWVQGASRVQGVICTRVG